MKERNHLVPEVDKSPLLNELHAMKQRMEALYSQSFGGEEAEPLDDHFEDSESWQPPVDIWETSQEWLLVADLPGVSDDDLQVELEDNRLTISGSRKTTPMAGGVQSFSAERLGGSFSRTFILPSNVHKDSIQAECKRGVLTVTIPKDRRAQTAPQKVIVQTE